LTAIHCGKVASMAGSRAIFRTVPDRDYLGFWADQTLKSRAVADFLDLDKRSVAKLAGVAPTSVRFDQKIPKEVLDRLQEIANICGLVAQFFDGDAAKTALWFKTKNPLLGDITPRDMIRYGRYEKLRRFIMNALEDNAAVPAPMSNQTRAESTEKVI
jgi:hypothetical protein